MPDVKKVNSGLLEFSEDQQILVAIDEDGEIQKAVVIDEDGSETPIGTTPSGKITITENGTDIDVAQYALADVAVPASASDFSTAEVSIVNSTLAALDIYLPYYEEAGGDNPAYSGGAWQVSANETSTLNVVLYKGTALAVFVGSVTLAITGDAEDLGGGSVVITGNATITASTIS